MALEDHNANNISDSFAPIKERLAKIEAYTQTKSVLEKQNAVLIKENKDLKNEKEDLIKQIQALKRENEVLHRHIDNLEEESEEESEGQSKKRSYSDLLDSDEKTSTLPEHGGEAQVQGWSWGSGALDGRSHKQRHQGPSHQVPTPSPTVVSVPEQVSALSWWNRFPSQQRIGQAKSSPPEQKSAQDDSEMDGAHANITEPEETRNSTQHPQGLNQNPSPDGESERVPSGDNQPDGAGRSKPQKAVRRSVTRSTANAPPERVQIADSPAKGPPRAVPVRRPVKLLNRSGGDTKRADNTKSH